MNMFLNFSVMPLRAATLVGLSLSALGGLTGLVVLVEAIINQPPAGWASLMVATLLISGCSW